MDDLEKEGYRVIDIPTPLNTNALYEGHRDNWGIDDIVICGQDNVSNSAMLEEMKNCNHLFCASPCKIYPATLGKEGEMINMIDFDEQGNQILYDMEYLQGKEFCNGKVGTGLSMIKKELQLKMNVVDNQFHHQNSDHTLSKLALPHLEKGFHLHGLHTHTKDF